MKEMPQTTKEQVMDEFDEKFTYQKPTRKYGKIAYTTPVLCASVEEMKDFITQSNQRAIEKTKQDLIEKVKQWAEKEKTMCHTKSNGRYKSLQSLLSFLSLIEQK